MIKETKDFFKCSKKLSFDTSLAREGVHIKCNGGHSISLERDGPRTMEVEPKGASYVDVSVRPINQVIQHALPSALIVKPTVNYPIDCHTSQVGVSELNKLHEELSLIHI